MLSLVILPHSFFTSLFISHSFTLYCFLFHELLVYGSRLLVTDVDIRDMRLKAAALLKLRGSAHLWRNHYGQWWQYAFIVINI
jgi:hypothetical protein